MGMARLLVTCAHLQRHIERYRAKLEKESIELIVPALVTQQFSAKEMHGFIQNADVVIAGDDIIDAHVLQAGKAGHLKAIIKWGIGTDAIDKEAARSLGIQVFNTPAAFSDEVADLALAYLLSLARGTCRLNAEVRSGRWMRYEGMSLCGKTAGVIGLGGIGKAIVTRCLAFGMEVLGYDIVRLPSEVATSTGVKQTTLDELLGRSHFVILACSLTPQNHHMIDTQAFEVIRDGAFLINVARGPLVDEAALLDALSSGKLAGAGLDVFEAEPLPASSPLRRFDQCIFGSHGGSSTKEAIERVNDLTIEIARTVCGGNPQDLSIYNRVA